MSEQFARRLREERERLGFSQKAFGELGGVSKNTQLAYENGASSIPLDYLLKLTKHGLDLGYVSTGSRAMLQGDHEVAVESRISSRSHVPVAKFGASPEDMVEIAAIDLNFGLGAAFMDSEIVEHQADTMLFPVDWLRSITRSPPEMLYWARGLGNSMEPTIGDGDVILIDRSAAGSTFGDLYWAIAYGQTGMIKRLRPMPDGSVKILSDNPNVPPEVAHDGELHVFGRVIAVVRRI